ncbi:MAG: pilus assembly protein TadG-related protein [Acidimicrobiia bacterium]|jgi:Tfp pilus assembly protein PilX
MRDDERGVVLIMVAVVMVVALAIMAIVVDLGNGRQQRMQAQSAADASAIAAAEEIASVGAEFTGTNLQWETVVREVKMYALNNFSMDASAWVGCSDPGHLAFLPDTANQNTCISADLVAWPNPQPGETTWINNVRVRTPTRTIETVFGGAVDASSLSTQAVAVAGVTRKRTLVQTSDTVTTPGGPCAICILADGLAFDGQNGDITVTGGGVVVNADPPDGFAASLNPNGHVRVNAASGIGGPGAPSKFSGSGFFPAPTTKPPVADPLANLPACGSSLPAPAPYASWPGCPTSSASSLDDTLNPGVYNSEITGSHTLNPGVYVLKAGIRLSGNQQITGRGVTLYFACANYPSPCSATSESFRNDSGITATGNGAVLLSGPTAATCQSIAATCPYVGLTIFADRNNTSTFTFRGNGTNENGSAEGSTGTIYLKSGTLDLRGNGYTLASQIITGKLTMDGNPSGITVAYDLSRNASESTTTTVTTTTEAYSYDATGLST